MILFRVVEQLQSTDVDLVRPMRDRNQHRRLEVTHRNVHVSGEQIARADRNDAHGMVRAAHRTRDRAHGAIAAHRNHHVRPLLEGFERTGAAVLVELRFNEHDVGDATVRAETLNKRARLAGRRLARVDYEGIMHRVPAAFVLDRLHTTYVQRDANADDGPHDHDDSGDHAYENQHPLIVTHCAPSRRPASPILPNAPFGHVRWCVDRRRIHGSPPPCRTREHA